jgi:hypothetical protein
MNKHTDLVSSKTTSKVFPFTRFGLAVAIFGLAMAAWSFTDYGGQMSCSSSGFGLGCLPHVIGWIITVEAVACSLLWMGVSSGRQITPWKQLKVTAAILVTLVFLSPLFLLVAFVIAAGLR